MKTREYITDSPEMTQNIAAGLLKDHPEIRVIALHGDLGAGKTCFVQGLASRLGINAPITSPTFTIINEYSSSRCLVHMDLYRLSSADEVLDLGFEDYLADNAVIAIEWPEVASEILPDDTLHVQLSSLEKPNERLIKVGRDND